MARFAKYILSVAEGRFPDMRSASADLDTLRKGNGECPQQCQPSRQLALPQLS